MKLFLAITLLFAGALAAPNKDFNPYVWRAGKGIDMSTIKSVNPTVNPVKAYNNPNKVKRGVTPLGFKNAGPAPVAAQEDCGIENRSDAPEDKIVGGQEAVPHQFPWLAVVLFNSGYLCTGSLVHPSWVLTAGHCIEGNDYVIQLGAHDRSQPEDDKIEISSNEVYQHPDYSPILLTGDVGLVKLPEPAPLSSFITLSCLPSFDDATNSFEGELTTITGWGKTHDVGAASSVLMFARDRPIIANSECINYYPLNVYDSTICTDTTGEIGTCSGDSGGPLNLQTAAGPYLQVGVTSYVSSAGCESGNPDGFSRVSEYLDWLEATTNGDIDIAGN